MKYEIGIARELRVVGQDSEYADIDNPNGDIIREVYFVTATTPEGRIYHHFFESQGLEVVDRIATRIKTHLMNTPNWEPIPGRWSHARNVYGSAAYVADGSEAQLAAYERAQEDGCLHLSGRMMAFEPDWDGMRIKTH